MRMIFGKKAALYIVPAIVILLAVGYFLLSFNRVLNPCDEGYLLCNYQKVAEGQLPHRDFYDDYGPAGYWVGGALFKIFGTRIIVFRIFLVILKAAMALLIFLIGRRILSSAFAFMASTLFILSWGNPLFPAFNILYAGHFSHFLSILGMLCILLYSDTGRKPWLFATSMCVGLSALFKFQVAMIDLAGFALFLCLKEQLAKPKMGDMGLSRECPSMKSLQFLRALKCLGVVGVTGFYYIYIAGPHLGFYYFFLFLFSYALFLLHMTVREVGVLRDMLEETRFEDWLRLKSLYIEGAILVSAPLMLVACVVILYLMLGGYRELIYDTFALPAVMRFHYPVEDRKTIAVITAFLVFVVMAAVSLGKMLKDRKGFLRSLYAVIVPIAVIVIPFAGVTMGFSYRIWHRLATHCILPATLLLGMYLFLKNYQQKPRSEVETGRFLSFGLVLIFACQSSLMTFVRSDEAHIVMNSTVIYIVAAYLLSRLNGAWGRLLREKALVPAWVLMIVPLMAVSAPYVWGMKVLLIPSVPHIFHTRMNKDGAWSYPMLKPDSPRARGLALPIGNPFPLNHPKIVDMNKTVDFIRENTGPGETIFVICDAQVVYFLAEHGSIIPKENYFVYLSNVGLIDHTSVVKISDEGMVQRVISLMPRFIIQAPKDAETVHFTLTWPKTYEFIRSNYDVAISFGDYEILRPRHPRLPINSP